MNKKKVLVTGGFGFIGSHLVEELIKNENYVIVIDNLSTGRLDNLKDYKNHSLLQPVICDICNYDEIEPYFKDVDYVFHLAALADIVPSIQQPDKYFKSNVVGTFNVLQASFKHNVKKFIYTASSSCYGIPKKIPTPEDAEIDTRYPYALTKRLGEELALHWGSVYKLPVISLRLFNVYGPRARTSGTYGAVFGVFLAQKLNNKPFTVVGDGNQTRDFTFVSDVVNAFIMASDSNITNEIFNVGSGGTYSINNLVKLLGGPIEYIPKRPGEPDCTFADITKIKKMLGWEPKVSFETGVKIMLENINYWKDAPLWTADTIKEATKEWFLYLSDSK